MSFTAEVKDELSRITNVSRRAQLVELSALIRICGTLSFRGPGRYSLRIATETGSVARTIIRQVHNLLGLETALTTRHSVLHKTRNYLIEILEQDGLEDALYTLGILSQGKGLSTGAPILLLKNREDLAAFIRGAFLAGGFIADPRGDFHLEIAVTGEPFAQDLGQIITSMGVAVRLNHRRGTQALYVKSFEDTVELLRIMGARRMSRVVEAAHAQKHVKNDVNRRVNAELANQARSTSAAAEQLALIDRADALIGIDKLPSAVAQFCKIRRAHPELSLAALGEELTPHASKSAMYHRLLRLQQLVQDAEANKET